tara:strand:+ start:115 stop:309 length:195 start_codon:yes stop_codon:yes gene_type:complete
MKIICDKCNGNGYLRLRGYDLEEAILQCDKCNSQGEVEEEKIEIIPPEFRITYHPLYTTPFFFG